MSMERKVYCGPVVRYKMHDPDDRLSEVLPDEPFSSIPVPEESDWRFAIPNRTLGSEPRKFYDPYEVSEMLEGEDINYEADWLFEEYDAHIKRLEKYAEVWVKWGFFVWWA